MKGKKYSENILVMAIVLSAILVLILFPSHETLAEFTKSNIPDEHIAKDFFQVNWGDDNLFLTTSDRYQKIDLERFESFFVNIPQLENRTREIHIYLPSDYKNGISSYPVVYLLEAQNIFINYGQTINDWYVDQSLYEFFSGANHGEVILVGIESDQLHKWDEYSPWVNEDMYNWIDPYEANRVEGGDGEAFLDFLVNTLKPQIDTLYRTLQDPTNTSIGGCKMGGLLSIYAGLTRSNVFSRVIALSPAVWFAENGGPWLSNNHLLKLVEEEGIPENISLTINLADEDQISNSNFKPYVFDQLGKKITFSQAYREGLKAVMRTLVFQGLPIENIHGEIKNSLNIIENSPQSIRLNYELIYKAHFPIVHTPGIPPQITTNSEATFYTNQNNSFLIVTTGAPVPTISIENLPKDIGIEFVDNGNGTATISGKPNVQDAKYFDLLIKAQNGEDPAASQQFRLWIADPSALQCPDSNSCIVSFTMEMSPYLDRTRKIWVYLPPNYNESDISYQVIYLEDEQHFFGEESGVPLNSLLDWKFDEKLDELYQRTGKGLIAVALEFDADYPWDEYTPWVNNNMDNWTTDTIIVNGVADKILDFMVMKLKPTIDTRYRTLPDRESTAIGGGSRCALFSIYAGLSRPGTFSKVMAMSPAIWMAEGGPVLPRYKPYWLTTNQLSIWFNENQAPKNVHFYLYIGTNENGPGGGYPFVYRINSEIKIEWPEAYKEGADKVKQKFIIDGVQYYYRINPGGTHYPGVWTDFIDEALLWFGFY